jgi:hypothetical protein
MVVFTINVSFGMPLYNGLGQVKVFATRELAQVELDAKAEALAESIWKDGEIVEVAVTQ